MTIYGIKFYLSLYDFKTSLYLKFAKLWNIKFQVKYSVHKLYSNSIKNERLKHTFI
jgi:hypothetical protein